MDGGTESERGETAVEQSRRMIVGPIGLLTYLARSLFNFFTSVDRPGQ